MALANLMMFPGHRLPPFDAMLWYAAREDTEFHVGWDCANPRTPWWVDRIRFDCSADPTDNSRRLKAILCSGVSQLRSLVLHARGCQTKMNLDDALTEWTTLRHLEIHNDGVNCITVSGLECLTWLVQLSSLNLTCCENLTDAGLQHLTGLAQLSSLSVCWCVKLTDAGLQYLAGLVHLSSLDLSCCENLTDAGLQHLTALCSCRR